PLLRLGGTMVHRRVAFAAVTNLPTSERAWGKAVSNTLGQRGRNGTSGALVEVSKPPGAGLNQRRHG
ncbi:MAG: hypothetical protein ABIR68_10145, partial [Ilumatobacteraceae bacterium]